jgi:hypothetical protein
MSYRPETFKKAYYQPTDHGREARMGEYLARLRQMLDKMATKS